MDITELGKSRPESLLKISMGVTFLTVLSLSLEYIGYSSFDLSNVKDIPELIVSLIIISLGYIFGSLIIYSGGELLRKNLMKNGIAVENCQYYDEMRFFAGVFLAATMITHLDSLLYLERNVLKFKDISLTISLFCSVVISLSSTYYIKTKTLMKNLLYYILCANLVSLILYVITAAVALFIDKNLSIKPELFLILSIFLVIAMCSSLLIKIFSENCKNISFP